MSETGYLQTLMLNNTNAEIIEDFIQKTSGCLERIEEEKELMKEWSDEASQKLGIPKTFLNALVKFRHDGTLPDKLNDLSAKKDILDFLEDKKNAVGRDLSSD